MYDELYRRAHRRRPGSSRAALRAAAAAWSAAVERWRSDLDERRYTRLRLCRFAGVWPRKRAHLSCHDFACPHCSYRRLLNVVRLLDPLPDSLDVVVWQMTAQLNDEALLAVTRVARSEIVKHVGSDARGVHSVRPWLYRHDGSTRCAQRVIVVGERLSRPKSAILDALGGRLEYAAGRRAEIALSPFRYCAALLNSQRAVIDQLRLIVIGTRSRNFG